MRLGHFQPEAIRPELAEGTDGTKLEECVRVLRGESRALLQNFIRAHGLIHLKIALCEIIQFSLVESRPHQVCAVADFHQSLHRVSRCILVFLVDLLCCL